MGQHFTLGAGPVQIMGQHVLPRLYGCRRLWPRKNIYMAECHTQPIATCGLCGVDTRLFTFLYIVYVMN